MPRDAAEQRVQLLYWTVPILREQYGEETIRAFLTGMHPDLRDRTPVEVLRDGDGISVIHAAQAFLDQTARHPQREPPSRRDGSGRTPGARHIGGTTLSSDNTR